MKLNFKFIKLFFLFISFISLNAFHIHIDKLTKSDPLIKLKVMHFYAGPRLFTNFIPIRWDSYVKDNEIVKIPLSLDANILSALTKQFSRYNELSFPEDADELFCNFQVDDSSYIYVRDECSGVGTYIFLCIDPNREYYYMLFVDHSMFYEKQNGSRILMVTNATKVQRLNCPYNVHISLKLLFNGFKVNENILPILDVYLEKNK